jgi:hypothetical protein
MPSKTTLAVTQASTVKRWPRDTGGRPSRHFRHALSTHGKQHFGVTAEEVKAQLRHTTTQTGTTPRQPSRRRQGRGL